jgi:broad specificity phosphatase PhoE
VLEQVRARAAPRTGAGPDGGAVSSGEYRVVCVERLLLARHAESEFNVRDLVNGDPATACLLTERGREQARRLGRRLAREDVDLCVTSQLQRTQQTADIAIAARSIPRLAWSSFNDPAVGVFEGGEAAAFNSWLRENGCDATPTGGESQSDARRRYIEAFSELLARPERIVVAVIHRLPIGLLVGALDGTGFAQVAYATCIRLRRAEAERALRQLKARPLETVRY